jgi:hypothetical protein
LVSGRFVLWTFCPHGRFVCQTFCPSGCFVPLDILSLQTFCPTDVMVCLRLICCRTFCLWTFCHSGHFVTLDVLSLDVLSGHQFNFLRTYNLCLKKLPNLGILINSLEYFKGKSILNTNYSANIQKKIKIISEHAYWDQVKLFDEETRDKNLVMLSL